MAVTAALDPLGVVKGRHLRRRQYGRRKAWRRDLTLGDGIRPTNPAAPAGVAMPGDTVYSTTTTPAVTIGNIPALVYGAALAPGSVGLYQIAIQVPLSLADGDWPIQASIGGVASPAGAVLTVKR